MFSDPSSEDFARFELGAGTPILLASVATVVVLVRSRLPPPPVRSSGGTVGRTRCQGSHLFSGCRTVLWPRD